MSHRATALALMVAAKARGDVEAWRFAKTLYLFGHHQATKEEPPARPPPDYMVGGDDRPPRHQFLTADKEQ